MKMGIPFTIRTAETDETPKANATVEETVAALSRKKAEAVRLAAEDTSIYIGSDTLLAFCGMPLGKPRDEAEAKAILSALRGTKHQVYTAITLLCGRHSLTRVAGADVVMRNYSDAEIDAYIATGEPMDKAGAYGIQGKGGALVARYDGDIETIVGFPSAMLRDMLRTLESLLQEENVP